MTPFICFSGVAPTIGDAAIGQGIIQRLKGRLDLPIHVRTANPSIFGALPEIGAGDRIAGRLPAIPRPRFRSPGFPVRLWRLVRDLRRTGGARALPADVHAALRESLAGCAAVIFQGGPAWTDRMMDRSRALDRALFLEAARYYGARTYHVGVSCGPFGWSHPERLWMAPLCRSALSRYDMLVVRDLFSRPALESLGVTTRIVESTDAAVFLHSDRGEAAERVSRELAAASGSRPRLVVALRDYQAAAYPKAWNLKARTLASLATVLDRVQRDMAQVCFLSTDHKARQEKESDVAVARQVQSMMTVPGSLIVDEEIRNPAALARLYGQFTAMISMRLHPTVLALAHGVPCLLLSYDEKCRDFFASLGLQQDAVPLADFAPGPAIARVAAMLADEGLRRRISARYGALRRAHATDYEPMFREIDARAQALIALGAVARRAPAPTAAGAALRRLTGDAR